MKKKIIILGSTGSIGTTTLKILKAQKNFKIIALTSNKNVELLYKQAIEHKVKSVIVEDENNLSLYKDKFLKKNIKIYLGLHNIKKLIKNKVDYCINSISGIEGLDPTLKMIPLTKHLLIANKEAIICGWSIIKSSLKKHNTKFIPLDSEHFSTWTLIKNEKIKMVDHIILTASGGPFLNIPLKKQKNINLNMALNHPTWKMGKKITIDSSTLMNKIFEFIEAKKIFNLTKNQISILIHPKSFLHAIVFMNGETIRILAHDTNMIIPISNALGIKQSKINIKFKIKKLTDIANFKMIEPDKKNFPLITTLKLLPNKDSYFETILITLNDELVDMYLNKKISYVSIHYNLLKFIKKPYFRKFYRSKPKNINNIKNMIELTKKYLRANYINYE